MLRDKLLEDETLRIALSAIFVSFYFLFETLSFKGYLLWHAGSLSSWLDVLRVSRPEMLFVAVSIFALAIFSLFLKRIWSRLYSKFFVLLIIIASLALVIHSALFLITGTGISRDYLQNFLKNPAEVNKMILAELRPLYAVLLILQAGLAMWLSRLPGSKFFTRLKERIISYLSVLTLRKITLTVSIIFLLVLELGALLPPLETVNRSITQMPFLELIKGFVPKKEAENLSIKIEPEERLDGEIELEPGPSFSPLNVVLIIFESLSWKYCDIYNPGLGATPFLEKLSGEGLVVERLYTVDPHTSKALIPVIAGIYPYPEPDVYEARPGILPEKALPHLLKKFGYRTGFFQTANNYEERPSVVANLGFEDFYGLFQLPAEGFADVNYFGKEEMMMLEPSLEWIEKDKDRPFFLTYLTLCTHHQYGFPPDFPQKDFRVGNKNLNRYLNAVRYTDYFISRVFEEFKKRRLLERTVFIIVGDHGEAFGEHGLVGHNYSLWEEGLRVPGIVYAPGLGKAQGTIDGFRSLLDVPPTVCELLGFNVKHGHFVGTSLLQTVEEDRLLYFTGWSKSRVLALRRGRQKYIFGENKISGEAYDNILDPEDRRNLYEADGRVDIQFLNSREQAARWFNAVAAQYVEWRKEAEARAMSPKPESFLNQVQAEFGGLVEVYGYGLFPTQTEPGRTAWIRAGLKAKAKIKRPVRLMLVLKHETGGGTFGQTISPRIPLDRLNPEDYTTADSIFVIPADWSEGKIHVFLSVLDEKPGTFLDLKVSGNDADENLLPLGKLEIFRPPD